jgi:hypothetical protein
VKTELTQERLKELLHYEPKTGIFTWLVSTSNRVKVGAVAGNANSPWIGIDGIRYNADKLSVLYTTGEWPAEDQIPEDGILTVERLKQLLEYSPDTGLFKWRVSRRKNSIKAGSVAGCLDDDGYVAIGIDGCIYRAHRLCFLYQTGAWPINDGDHENRIRHDNRWDNLRDATHQQNRANTTVHVNNRLGAKGVHRRPSGKFRAQINVNGKLTRLGTFTNIEDAKAAYATAANDNFGAFARVA